MAQEHRRGNDLHTSDVAVDTFIALRLTLDEAHLQRPPRLAGRLGSRAARREAVQHPNRVAAIAERTCDRKPCVHGAVSRLANMLDASRLVPAEIRGLPYWRAIRQGGSERALRAGAVSPSASESV
jgi:hypothetical protein